jgi:hypothetical protein
MTERSEEPRRTALMRFCIHHKAQPPGAYYSGTEYVAALQRLKADAAVKATGNIEAFFWKDAPTVQLWLCHECARALALRAEPTS